MLTQTKRDWRGRKVDEYDVCNPEPATLQFRTRKGAIGRLRRLMKPMGARTQTDVMKKAFQLGVEELERRHGITDEGAGSGK